MTIKELPPIEFPKTRIDVGDLYSNFDDILDEQVKIKLKEEGTIATHAAWDFCGYIWFSEESWFELVMQYKRPVALYKSDDLEELLLNTKENYGWE